MLLNCFVVFSIFAFLKQTNNNNNKNPQKQSLYNIPLPVLLSPSYCRVDVLYGSDYQRHSAYIWHFSADFSL